MTGFRRIGRVTHDAINALGRRSAGNQWQDRPEDDSEDYQPSPGEKRKFYDSWDWRTLRMRALKENDGRCECCGLGRHDCDLLGAPVKLHVDHIKPISRFWSRRLDPTNLQILCGDCNQGKGGWDETDWRLKSATLPAQICAARTALHAAEVSGHWPGIEAAHGRLLGFEIEQWLQGRG